LTSLTPRQREIYLFIEQYRDRRGYSPTQQEIADGTNICRSTLLEHLASLERKGYISLEENIPRSIIIINNNQ